MELFLLLATLALSVAMGGFSLQLPQLAADPGGPSLFPLAAASITGLACVLLIGQRLFFATRPAGSFNFRDTVQNLVAQARQNSRQLGTIVLVLAYPLGIDWLGFVAATLLFSFLVLVTSGKSLAIAIIASMLITAGIYVAYAIVLGAVLPQGQLLYQYFY